MEPPEEQPTPLWQVQENPLYLSISNYLGFEHMATFFLMAIAFESPLVFSAIRKKQIIRF